MKTPFKGFLNRAYPEGSITQFFGENPALYAALDLAGHNGLDCVSFYGDPIYAVEGGIVEIAENTPLGFGGQTKIITDSGNEWTYAHQSKILVKTGDMVTEGQCIGAEGNTGFVVSSPNANGFWHFNPHAGTHLHLGLRKVREWTPADPNWHINMGNKRYIVLNYDNGFKGAVDPLPLTNIKPFWTFSSPILFGQTSDDVRQLQACLAWEGLFTDSFTGYYGFKTASAVLALQKKYQVADVITLNQLQGKRVGPATLVALNKIYGNI